MSTCRNCGLEIVFTDRAFYNDEEDYFASGWVDVKDRYFVCVSGLPHNPEPEDPEEFEDAEFVSAADLPDDMFPEWDDTAETADDARRGK